MSGEILFPTGGGLAGTLFEELSRELDAAGVQVPTVGRIELRELLGRGGMGEVYLGVDTALGRRVAVKCLRRDRPLSDAAKARIRREALLLSRLAHPGICGLHDLVETEHGDHLILELVDGRELTERIAEGLEVDEALELGGQILAALAAAHSRGVVHRDLKPSNVVVDEDGRARILDFGIARTAAAGLSPGVGGDSSDAFPVGEAASSPLTREGVVLGTIAYMSPEQASDSDVGPATDVYSCGLLLLEMLTGRPERSAGDPEQVLAEIRSVEVPVPGELDPGLRRLLHGMLARDAASRPTAEEARAALDEVRSMAERRRRRWRRSGMVAIAALGLLAALLLGLERASARNEARLLARLEPRVTWIERFMEHARTEPLHDISEERDVARLRVAELEAELRSEGRLDERASRAALGRARWAIGDRVSAAADLRRAWEAGLRSPEVAIALGSAWTQAFEDVFDTARDLPPGQERQAAIAEAERRYRDPARAVLREAEGADLEAPELVEAVVADASGEPDRALELLDSVLERLPWLYQAHFLAARIEQRRGYRAAESEGPREALAGYERAWDHLTAALRIGRSDPAVHAQRCLLSELVVVNSVHAALDSDELRRLRDRGIEACRQASSVDGEALFLGTMGAIEARFGEALYYRGEDARPSFERAISWIRGHLEEEPTAADWDRLGVVYDLVAYDETYRGLDPRPTLEKALAAYDEVERLDPDRRTLPGHRLYAHLVRATWETENGADPAATEASARAILDAAVARDPETPNVRNSFGMVVLYAALHDEMVGRDPGPRLERAIAAFRDEHALRPGNPFPIGNVGHALTYRAEWEVSQGRDPTGTVGEAREAVEAALEIQPDLYYALADAGRLSVVEARWRAGREGTPGADVEALLDAAADWTARAVDANADDTWTVRVHAEVALARAEMLPRSGRDVESWRRRAVERATRALELNPRNAEAFVVRASAHLLGSDSGTAPEASADLRRALEINPSLERRVARVRAGTGAEIVAP